MHAPHSLVFISGLALLSTIPPVEAAPTCTDHSVSASSVHTPRDVEAFVQCAYELVNEVGFERARQAFHQDPRWNSGTIYVFVTGLGAEVLVSPILPEREGGNFGEVVDLFESDLFKESPRIVRGFGRGWVYYSFLNPETGFEEPKASYVIGIDWDGTPGMIGAGIYQRDIPGTCRAREVNAALLDETASDEGLREFVRCAANEVESNGYFALPLLSREPRWRSGSIYLFGIDVATGAMEFSGRNSAATTEARLSGLFDGRDMVSVAASFGEAFWYYDSMHPVTGRTERKVTYVKRVVTQGRPLLVGAGYYPGSSVSSN